MRIFDLFNNKTKEDKRKRKLISSGELCSYCEKGFERKDEKFVYLGGNYHKSCIRDYEKEKIDTIIKKRQKCKCMIYFIKEKEVKKLQFLIYFIVKDFNKMNVHCESNSKVRLSNPIYPKYFSLDERSIENLNKMSNKKFNKKEWENSLNNAYWNKIISTIGAQIGSFLNDIKTEHYILKVSRKVGLHTEIEVPSIDLIDFNLLIKPNSYYFHSRRGFNTVGEWKGEIEGLKIKFYTD